MKKSQLIDILLTLDKSEVREFRKWLLSPVHNQREDVVQLYDYLMSANHLQEDKFLEKEWIYRKLFSKEAYNDARLRQVNHFLNRCLEEYLSYKEWQEDQIGSKVPLITQFRKRKLSKQFTRTVNSLQQAQKEHPYRNDQYFRNEYLIQLELYDHLHERLRTPENNLQEIADTLDHTYFLEKLRLSCRMIFHQTVHKTDFNFGPLDKLFEHLESHNLLQDPVIAVYYYIFKAVTEAEKDQLYFEKLRLKIQTSGNLFTNTERKEVYLMAVNYCIRKMNAGEERFVREAFEWYKQGFKIDILVDNNLISRWTYLNVVLIALRLKEFEWTKNFIEEYKDLVEMPYRESFRNYSLARLYFEQKDYDQAMDLLIRFEHDDILINLNARTLLIKIYYEKDEFDVLESLLDSTRIFIKRRKVQDIQKLSYLNIVKFTKKLVRINPFDKKEQATLRASLLKANPVAEKQWLLEQLDKL